MKTVKGQSPHASWESEERFSAKVSVDDSLKLRIGRGKRARIAQLGPQEARQLAYELIEVAAKVEAKTERYNARRKGWDAGFNAGYRDAKREMRYRKKK